MKAVAVLMLSLALATSARAATYRGKVWSWATGGTIAWREVMQPTGTVGLWIGRAQCVSLTRGLRCLQRHVQTTIFFAPNNTFVSAQSNGCRARGVGNPDSGGLTGTYGGCPSGDYGTFNLRRVR